jgi:ribosomal protein S18 acetylase RimI-like enzyme
LKSGAYREVVERQFGPWDERFQRELFAARWNPTISRIVVVDGMAAGLVALVDRVGELWLDEIQMASKWRGKGIGSAIIRGLIDQARADRKPIRLHVLRENARAQRLYRQLGFFITGETANHVLMECGEAPGQRTNPDETSSTRRPA